MPDSTRRRFPVVERVLLRPTPTPPAPAPAPRPPAAPAPRPAGPPELLARAIATVEAEVQAAVDGGRTLPRDLHRALALALGLRHGQVHALIAAASWGRGVVLLPREPGRALYGRAIVHRAGLPVPAAWKHPRKAPARPATEAGGPAFGSDGSWIGR